MLQSVDWSESFAAGISKAAGSDLSFIQDEFKRGGLQLWEYRADGENLTGYAVTRLEGDTLVVVAYEGQNVLDFGWFIVSICELKGLAYARFHTQKPGLIKLLAELEPEPLEYVMRVPINGRT